MACRYFPTQQALLLQTAFLGDSGPLRSLSELANEFRDRPSASRMPSDEAQRGRSNPVLPLPGRARKCSDDQALVSALNP
jgi:hypothetical protein